MDVLDDAQKVADSVVGNDYGNPHAFRQEYQQRPLEIQNPCPECDTELKKLPNGRLRCTNQECLWRSPPSQTWSKG